MSDVVEQAKSEGAADDGATGGGEEPVTDTTVDGIAQSEAVREETEGEELAGGGEQNEGEAADDGNCPGVAGGGEESELTAVKEVGEQGEGTGEATVAEGKTANEERAMVEPPTSGSPTTEPQTTEPPTTEPQTTEPLTAEPPTTEPPTTEPPTTEPPTTEPPTTEPPTTEPLTAEPPTTEPATAEGEGEVTREREDTAEPGEAGEGVAAPEKGEADNDIACRELETRAQEDEGGVATEEGVAGQEEGVVSPVVELSESCVVSASRAPLENITEEDEDEEDDEQMVDRAELINNCQEALRVQERLRQENAQLQHKIAEYLSHKKEEKPDPGRNVTDQEKRYLQCLSALDQLEEELGEMRVGWAGRETEGRELCARKQADVVEKTGEFLRYQEEGARQAVDSHTGHKLSDSEMKRLQAAQLSSDQAVFQARLENIKLVNKTERMESLLKQKEELAEGLHMLDFEQLKISNMDLGEKVEERNEDIRKLAEKVRATVQVLTHIKEKLSFLQEESEKKKANLQQLDSDLAMRRELLTRLKQARDAVRLDNQRLRQTGGLLCHTELLRDFEERQDQNTELERRLQELKSHHSQTTLECAGLRRKITQTTAQLPLH